MTCLTVSQQQYLDELYEEISGARSIWLLMYPLPAIMTLFYIKKFSQFQRRGGVRKLTCIIERVGGR